MKLTDENGNEYQVANQYTIEPDSPLRSKCSELYVVFKIEPPKAKAMPELRPGMIVRIDDRSLNRKDLIIIQDIDRDENLWGINIERGWQRMKFYDREIIEVCYPRTIDVIWRREP